MEKQPIVSIIEQRLHSWAIGSLLLATAFRLLWGYLSTQSIWLNDSQVLVVSLITACLIFGGCLIPIPWSYLVSFVIGAVGWLVAASLIPPSLWSQYPATRTELPGWLVWGAILLALIGFVVKAILEKIWRRELVGHGYQWMLEWATGRPYFARLTAKKVLKNLGFQE